MHGLLTETGKSLPIMLVLLWSSSTPSPVQAVPSHCSSKSRKQAQQPHGQ
jgi:hypothetical protein